MEYILVAIVLSLVIYIIFKVIYNSSNDDSKVPKNKKMPYYLSDKFLTPAEFSFYKVLSQYIENRAVICPKVGLKDFFFVGKDAGKEYYKYFRKISQKHVDFLLCEPISMKPICGIELDDSSHTSKKSYQRDIFVEKLYNDANFPLVRFSTKSGYSIAELDASLINVLKKKSDLVEQIKLESGEVICPKCQVPMILRKSSKGANSGKEFYGCVNFPNCREVLNKN
jgi:ssDNA-binding Zn-finger/Zn-ribbon topoisomerase 1